MFGFVNGLAIIIFMSQLDPVPGCGEWKAVWMGGAYSVYRIWLGGCLCSFIDTLATYQNRSGLIVVAILAVAIVVSFDIYQNGWGYSLDQWQLPALCPFYARNATDYFPYAAMTAGVG